MQWEALTQVILLNIESLYGSKFYKLNLYLRGFIALVKHSEKIITLVEMMFCGHGNKLTCFEKGIYLNSIII